MTFRAMTLTLTLLVLPLAACVEETDSKNAGSKPPTFTNRADGMSEVVFHDGCSVVFNRKGKVVSREPNCSKKQMRHAHASFRADTAEQNPNAYGDV